MCESWRPFTVPISAQTAAAGTQIGPSLKTIPDLDLCEIPEAGICCGSAGIYNLVEPEAASDLGDRKAHHILATEADALVSSNPGCLLQIASRLAPSKKPLRTYHLVELLDASIRGTTL